MNLYTIGFTKKSAKQFFELIKEYKIKILVDIRLNNKSQLAGFTKGNDLKYFLSEICDCSYEHCLEYAPTKDILDDYKNKRISWSAYVERYSSLINSRKDFYSFVYRFDIFENVCLLCSEATHKECHRRILAEMIAKDSDIRIKHI